MYALSPIRETSVVSYIEKISCMNIRLNIENQKRGEAVGSRAV